MTSENEPFRLFNIIKSEMMALTKVFVDEKDITILHIYLIESYAKKAVKRIEEEDELG